ncbi:MAG TPA: hypothetical protein VMU82_10605 [Acetobacteraceae bacterium]|nr:hypothetical protein [Acetobacteraceae bacterium]
MTNREPRYPDLAIRPQIVRNAPLLTFFIAGDLHAIGPQVPPPLSPHPNGRIVLNMWFLPNPEEMTGFGEPGPMGVTYLATEVAGEEGASADGATRFPGRFWLEHWSSSSAARQYAHRASGLEIKSGDTRLHFQDGFVTATLRLADRAVVTARARVGRDRLKTVSGHSIYYAERDAEARSREVARYEVPWVSDAYAAEGGTVEFNFPEDERALRVVANGRQTVTAVSFRKITLVPYIAQNVVERSPR